MKKFLKNLVWLIVLGGTSLTASATGMVWGESNWGEADWGIDEVRAPVTPPAGPVPVSSKIRSITGSSTNAGISAGAYADNGAPAYGNTFTSGDYITIIAEISPDSADVGSNGELIVVLLSFTGGKQQWSFLNSDGNFESWNLQLGTLGAAQIAQPLETLHALTIFEGDLQPGKHRMAVGYMADGGPLIYTAKAINITVSD